MFVFGRTSEGFLAPLHPDLVRVLRRGLTFSEVDFSIVEGLRTSARQHQLVAAGASQTMDSRHMTGHAADVAPYVGGQVRWDWPLVFKVADAMLKAAHLERVPIRWGGAWDWDSAGTMPVASAESLSDAYAARCRAQGRRPFLDGAHWELPRNRYP